ncbi:MAG: hypothetical protein D9V47_04215 [Clostridia bacterium]|nr:MAG: hypothetical protein D9V47_04215 [Clostridia bacterium]
MIAVPEKHITFTSGNLRLEGRLWLPPVGPSSGVVICHPHPLHGGDMENYVVRMVAGDLASRGLAVLRFNFRGVGLSGGVYAGGLGEQEDARAALEYLASWDEVAGARLGLCGYSFGGLVAFSVGPQEERVAAIAGISPLLPDHPLSQCLKPKLFVFGQNDQVIPVAEAVAQAQAMPAPREVVVIPGADHFWWGREMEAAVKVGEFFAREIGTSG